MSNYPPGVTGNEYEISGPDGERETEEYCPTCETDEEGMKQWHHQRGVWWTCYNCDRTINLDDDPRDQ